MAQRKIIPQQRKESKAKAAEVRGAQVVIDDSWNKVQPTWSLISPICAISSCLLSKHSCPSLAAAAAALTAFSEKGMFEHLQRTGIWATFATVGWGMYLHTQPQCTPPPSVTHSKAGTPSPPSSAPWLSVGLSSVPVGQTCPQSADKERSLQAKEPDEKGHQRDSTGGRNEGSHRPGAGAECVWANTQEGNEHIVLLFLTTSTSICSSPPAPEPYMVHPLCS